MLPLLLALLAASPAAPRAERAQFAIHAKAVWTGGGRVLEDATVLVNDGRIAAVGTKVEVPPGVEIVEHDGVLTAGLVALHGQTGAAGATRDDTRPALPEARVGLVIDARSPDFARLRAAGITSVVVTPDASRLSMGTSAVVKSEGAEVLRDPAHLSLVFSDDAFVAGREPTSYAGALVLMRRLFAEPRGVVAQAKSGRLPCLFEVKEREDVRRALAFAREQGLVGALHGAALAGEIAAEIAPSGLAVVVPALGVGAPRRTLDAVVALGKERVPFGFGLDAPWNHADTLRLSAALCVRAGLDAQVAWDALTATAAKIAGVDARVGRIERGLDADLVLWSGDPLDLASTPVHVLVDGRRVDVEEGR